MILKSWPRWLKLATLFDGLIMLLAGGFGTLWLWAMLPHAPPEVNQLAVLTEQVCLFLVLPVAIVFCLGVAANSLQNKGFDLLAYLAMSLPLFAVPFVFWEALR